MIQRPGQSFPDPSPPGERDVPIVDRDHLREAASAIEQVLAYAHEDGQEETVRVLLAVVAVLRAAPRHQGD